MPDFTILIRVDLDDVSPGIVVEVAVATAKALTQLPKPHTAGVDRGELALAIVVAAANLPEAHRTSEVVVGAIRPLVSRVHATSVFAPEALAR